MNPSVPDFFERVRPIRMRDPLAQFLGAPRDGGMEYSYLDAVNLTGHSCPTVAGAYQATAEALTELYPGELPERGAIRVELRGAAEEGVTGVVASVAALITGAAGEGGFKGIAGRFARQGLLAFHAPISKDLRFTRVDTGAAVDIDLPAAPAMSAELRDALRKALSPVSSSADRAQFAQGWQARVEALLRSEATA